MCISVSYHLNWKTEAEHVECIAHIKHFKQSKRTIRSLQIGGQRAGRGGNGPFLTKQYHYFSSLGQECHISQPTTLLQMSIKAHWRLKLRPGPAAGHAHTLWPLPHLPESVLWLPLREMYIKKWFQQFKVISSNVYFHLMYIHQCSFAL